MIKFFRKIRYNLMEKNKTGKYFKYAIGEIVLVVIGILIALSINNWNEKRLLISNQEGIYKQVRLDLIKDTLNLEEVIDYYEKKDIRMEKVLQKQFPKINIDFPSKKEDSIVDIYFGDISNSFYHTVQNKGYELIKETSHLNSIKNDTLSSRIIEFYVRNRTAILMQKQVIQNKVGENIKFFEQYSWFVDWMKHRYNKDAYVYFSESEVYRKKVASFQSSSIRNYLKLIKKYNSDAKELIKIIDNYSLSK
jgi:uncharacterized protein YbgA (DUF1722 family)